MENLIPPGAMEQMLRSPFNDDLAEYFQKDPVKFRAAFDGLMEVNRDFAMQPMIAGEYMRRIFQMKPENAGSVLIDAYSRRNK